MPEGQHVAAEVLSASIGGMFSASALYPLEVLKTKVQAANASIDNESQTSPKNDISKHDDAHDSGKDDDNDNRITEESSLSSLQVSTPIPASTISLAKKMYREEGISAFYHGVGTSAFQSATEKALYFFAYTWFKNIYTSITSTTNIGTLTNLTLGCAAEWAHLPITLPIDCLTTKIQTSTSNAGAYALMTAMLSEKGFAGMYKGIQAYTVLCFKPSIQYTVYEQIKRTILAGRAQTKKHGMSKHRNELSAAEAFLLGIIARTIATVAVFPYLRAKVMLQSTSLKSTDDSKGKISIPKMLIKMYENDGFMSLFQGLGPELTRGIFSAALMLMVKEKITGVVSNAIKGTKH